LAQSALGAPAAPLAVFQADGIKIGEVLTDQAVVWTRLTRQADLARRGVPFVKIAQPKSARESHSEGQIPAGARIEDMQDAVPGAPGEVRVVWGPDVSGGLGTG
jgi:phosphodiesterase/alkaline phosphatase D-like protein